MIKHNKIIYRWNKEDVLAPADAEVLRYGMSAHIKPHILYNNKEYKHCACCKSWKRLTKFHVEKQTWDGLQGFCIDCNNSINNQVKYKIIEDSGLEAVS